MYYEEITLVIEHRTCNNAFLLTVSNSQLRGQSDLEKAQVLQWLGFADSEILPASHTWVFPCLGIMQYNKQVCNLVSEFSYYPDWRTDMKPWKSYDGLYLWKCMCVRCVVWVLYLYLLRHVMSAFCCLLCVWENCWNGSMEVTVQLMMVVLKNIIVNRREQWHYHFKYVGKTINVLNPSDYFLLLQ